MFLQVSNIIFLDQPVGTGFSATNNSTDYATQIATVGVDVYDFLQVRHPFTLQPCLVTSSCITSPLHCPLLHPPSLQDFLAVYPGMANRSFSLTGESYTPAFATEFILVPSSCFLNLQDFLAVYPGMANRSFYLTGESYAGHYVPTIATKILQENAKKTPGAVTINLKVRAPSVRGP